MGQDFLDRKYKYALTLYRLTLVGHFKRTLNIRFKQQTRSIFDPKDISLGHDHGT